MWCYVVWWGAVCVRRRSGVLRGGGVIGWYTWVLCGVLCGRVLGGVVWWGAAQGGVIGWYTWVLYGAVLLGAMW